jgi:hypothetical protein
MTRSRTLLLTVSLVLTAISGVARPAKAITVCPLGPCTTDASCLPICCNAGFCPYEPWDQGPVCHHDTVHNCTTCYC